MFGLAMNECILSTSQEELFTSQTEDFFLMTANVCAKIDGVYIICIVYDGKILRDRYLFPNMVSSGLFIFARDFLLTWVQISVVLLDP